MKPTQNDSIFTKELVITPSMCDTSATLGYANTFALFQDIASEHAEQIGVGTAAMAARGVFWLTVHTRVQFFQKPPMLQTVTAQTWPGFYKPKDRRCFRYYRLMQGERLLAQGKTEWAILSLLNGRLCPLSDTGFPEDFIFSEETVCPEPLLRFTDPFTENDAVMQHIVRASDTDFGGHMNNVAYVRTLLDSFSAKELVGLPVEELEIHFSTPSFEGEELTVCRTRCDEGWLLAAKKDGGKASVLARLKCGEKETL